MANDQKGVSNRRRASIIQIGSLLGIIGLAIFPAFSPRDVIVPFYVWAFLGGALLGADPKQFTDILDAIRRIVRGGNGTSNGT